MLVKEVQLNCEHDVRRFIEFPFNLYRRSPYWVPPLYSSARLSLDPDVHPFYKHSKAAFYIAESSDSGEVQGRLAAINNMNYNRYNSTKTAFFSFFDCYDNRATAEALFSAAIGWAKTQGLKEMIGPRGLSVGDGGGILIEGFEHAPAMGVPYNHDYYDRLVLLAGFKKNTDYFSGYLSRNNTLSVRYRRVALKLAERRGFKVKEFNKNGELNCWMERIVKAHGEAFTGNHTYFPPTLDEIEHLKKVIKMVAEPQLVKVALKGQDIVGFLIGLPDLSDALRKSNGRLWPWGWHHLYMGKKKTKKIIVTLLAVHPAYRGRGIVALLYAALAESFYRNNYERLELVTVEENNRRALYEYDQLGTCWYKKHRDYRLAI